MDINDIRIKLNELKDEGYAKFNKKSCPDTAKEILGIKIPQLRILAKQIIKNNKDIKLINEMDESVFEETILKGLIIAYSTINIDEKLILVKNFIPEIDSWAITDTFCPTLKIKTERRRLAVTAGFFWRSEPAAALRGFLAGFSPRFSCSATRRAKFWCDI